MGLSKILTASLLVLRLFPGVAVTASTTALDLRQDQSSSYWFSTVKRQGKAAFGEPGHTVFRNVKDFGAKGDGVTDDSDAINKAVQDGPNRCIQKCDSRTNAPAIVYFPPGTYLVSKAIVQTYYTQFVGDAVNVPTIKATPDFEGMGVIDANPYDYTTGKDPAPNWYVNQNNFFRQIRNFIIDMRDMPINKGAGIHWQVSQATSLQNIVFELNPDTSSDNVQKGLFIENGSGGFFANLTFNGGGICADIGSQQFTTRDLTFNNCNTAIHMIWDWVWLMQGVTINGGKVGIDMTSDSIDVIKVGSLLLIDSKISNTEIGISTLYKPDQLDTNNTLILDNVDMTQGVKVAIQHAQDKSVLLEGNRRIDGFVQGREYTGQSGKAVQSAQKAMNRPKALLNEDGEFFTRVKPQYENVPAAKIISMKSSGAKGDGKADDTAVIQRVFDNAKEDDVIYFDHGAYLIHDTIKVPKNIRITGEMWPLLMATGDKFTDETKPVPVFQVGEAGDVGTVEMSDLIIETKGSLPGAILMQWNLAGSENGAAGLWDVHFRIAGTAGTELQSDKCSKNPNVTTEVNPVCMGAFMLLHLTQTASTYIENCWFWVADHELDLDDHNQINIYNGRGVLIEAQKPVWLWGTASEHSVLYNYQISNAKNTFIGLAQSETAYMQGNPDATQGAVPLEGFFDPDFKTSCDGSSTTCARTWGLRITNSSDVFVLGAGLYSFFDNYAQECVDAQNCQDNMISIEESSVSLYGVSTKASINMITLEGKGVALDKDNRNNFCGAIAKFSVGDGPNSPAEGPNSSQTPQPTKSHQSSSTRVATTTLPGIVTASEPANPTGGYGSGSGSGSGNGNGNGSGSGSGDGSDSGAGTGTGTGSGSGTGNGSGSGNVSNDGSGTSVTGGVIPTQSVVTPIPTPSDSYNQPGGETSILTTITNGASATNLPLPTGTQGIGGEAPAVVTVTETVTASVGCQSP